jgi:hypothetical protein
MYQNAPEILKYPTFVNPYAAASFFSSAMTQDVDGEIAALWGSLQAPGWTSGTKVITGVEVVYNSVTAGTGSTWRVSLQDLVTDSSVTRPDGVLDQVWTGDPSSFTANSVVTHTFATTRTVSPGDRLAVAFDYAVFGSGSIIAVRTLGESTSSADVGVAVSSNAGSTWSSSGSLPAVAFVCDDGSRVYFYRATVLPVAVSVSGDYSAASTGTGIDSGDERGMLWVPKKAYTLTGFSTYVRMTGTTSALEIRLYRDTTLLASREFGPAQNRNLSNPYILGMTFSSPIQVGAGENIRAVVRPTVGSSRWYRYTFSSTADIVRFFGGSDYETDLQITNRVDDGAWNQPTGGGAAFTPTQFYGTAVPESSLPDISGTHTISGNVSFNGTPTSGATVRCFRASDGGSLSTTTDGSGNYSFGVAGGHTYHVFVEREDAGVKYNAKSLWNITPIAP